MTVAFTVLSLALLVALLHVVRANGRERQELLSAHQNELVRLERSHRLEMDAARAERAGLLERLHTTAADQVAAVVRSIPPPAEKRAPVEPNYIFPLDDDLRLLEPID